MIPWPTTAFRGVPVTGFRRPAILSLLGGGVPSGLPGQGILVGAKGETVTVVRATSKTCENAAGSVFTVGPNLPAVDYRGLSVEAAHTNLLLRSQEFDAVPWADFFAGGVSAATVTPNAGVAPDGTTTADQIDIPAVTITQRCTRGQVYTAAAGPHTVSIWAKAVTPGSTTYISLVHNITGTIVGQLLIQPSTTTWTRYFVTGTTLAGDYAIGLGVLASLPGSTQLPQAASSILYWGAQIETGSYAHSYVLTTAATATCSADLISMPFATLPTSSGAVEVDFSPLWTSDNGGAVLFDTRSLNVNPGIEMFVIANTLNFLTLRTGQPQTTITSAALTWTPGLTYRCKGVWGNGNMYLYRDFQLVASNVTGTVPMPEAHTAFRIGTAFTDGFAADGFISNLTFSTV